MVALTVKRSAGHLWTIVPSLAGRLRPPETRGEPWETRVEDVTRRPVRIYGRWFAQPGAEAAVVVVHGLGGGITSTYLRGLGPSLQRAGFGTLLLGLRGADATGEDIYHAGLYDDLLAALHSPELAPYPRRYVLGFSMGGHIALRLAQATDAAAAVVAVCAPLDLGQVCAHIDHTAAAWIYRRYLLNGLIHNYAAVARAGGEVPTPVAEVRRVLTLHAWDAKTVVPRFGFPSVEAYHEAMSAGPGLHALRAPTLLVQARHDPMIPPSTFEHHLRSTSALTLRWVETGGHLGFPSQLSLGFPGPRGLLPQIVAWLQTLR